MRRDFRPGRLAVAVLVGAAFFAGLGVDHVARAARRDGSQPYRSLDTFAEVLSAILNNYVEEVKEKDLVYGAIDGMVGKLDPHSLFMRPDVYRMMRDETTGEFDGVGLEVTVREDVLTVVSPVADSPGERAGLRPGDRILKIDGAPTRDLTLVEVIRRMKGPAGTKVVLEIMRDGFAAPQTLTVVRDHVRTISVESRVLDPELGYVWVKVKSFQDRTDRALKKALDDARASLRGEVKGLVLDLRNDPGGLLDQAVRVADRFLASGVIVTTEGRNKRNVEVEKAREKDTEPGYPMIVLVNRGTASASEIVAGALQDHGRAVIMGTQTFGKGSVQTVVELEDGSGLKLTIAKYYTPKHRSIQELGITPDVVVPEAAPPVRGEEEVASERDLRRHLKNEGTAGSPAQAPKGSPLQDDYQLRTAVDYLKAAHIFKASSGEAPGRAAKR
ncbi:MAG TPA: S41 family peptidase [Anaeromyxobacteraceae bacterium]|nr:S41 family peptidase [Anaeromyxobacteraceae bacterium]